MGDDQLVGDGQGSRATFLKVSIGTGSGGFRATNYPVSIGGVTGHDLVIRQGFFGGLKLLIDGESAPTESTRKQRKFIATADDGIRIEVILQSGWFGSNPEMLTASRTTPIGRRIEGLEWLWVGIPLAHILWNILDGGALGVLAGFAALFTNVRIFTNDGTSTASRYLVSLAAMVGLLLASIALSIALLLILV